MKRLPDGQEVIDSEDEQDVERLVRAAIQSGLHYYEHKRGDSALLKTILGMVSALAITGIVGAISLYGQFSSLSAKVEAMQAQLYRLEARVDRAAP
jgi:hypothetical protein